MASEKYIEPILSLPRPIKRALALAVDTSLCALTVWLAYCLRLDHWVTLRGIQFLPIFVSLLLALPLFITMGLYRAIFRYAGWAAFTTVAKAVTIYGLIFAVIFTAVSVPGVPRSIGILQPLLLLVAISVSRLTTRYFLGAAYQRRLSRNRARNVFIYGAGHSGRQLAGALASSFELKVAGFLDDDHKLHGSIMGGIPIYDPADLPELVARKAVTGILLAIPSASRKRRNEILEAIRKAKVSVRSVPDVTDLARGRVHASDLQELNVEDLLGRDSVVPDPDLMAKNITGKSVMVTGAGGSIGSELCRQVLKLGPSRLVLFEQSEYALYAIHAELSKLQVLMGDFLEIVAVLGSVRDAARLKEALDLWHPETIYHAAAYKHVPLVEDNPAEGIRNNTLGTLTTALAAIEAGVSSFVLISTDKAVRPTNVMGASKRLSEMVLQALAEEQVLNSGGTVFSMVRFGNVLGSSGSVVPLFREQINEGGPVTLTHPEITRYFMTIPEASQLVIQAGAMASGGDLFVLNMGEPVRIIDLARRMIELAGFSVRDENNPDGDIEIEIVGLRPGEKLYEELLIGDNPQPTSHPLIMKAREEFLPFANLKQRLQELEASMQLKERETLRHLLQKLVAGYEPENGSNSQELARSS